MTDKSRNGWKLIGTVTTIFIVLVGYVVANDRLRANGDKENNQMRASEDIRISKETDVKIEKVENRVVKRLDEFQKEQRGQGKEISGLRADSKNNMETLARIEAKM